MGQSIFCRRRKQKKGKKADKVIKKLSSKDFNLKERFIAPVYFIFLEGFPSSFFRVLFMDLIERKETFVVGVATSIQIIKRKVIDF